MVKMPSNKNMLEVVTPLLTFPNLRALPMLRRFADRDWCIMISAKGGKFMDTAKIKTAMKFCFPEGNKQEIKPGFNLKIQVLSLFLLLKHILCIDDISSCLIIIAL